MNHKGCDETSLFIPWQQNVWRATEAFRVRPSLQMMIIQFSKRKVQHRENTTHHQKWRLTCGEAWQWQHHALQISMNQIRSKTLRCPFRKLQMKMDFNRQDHWVQAKLTKEWLYEQKYKLYEVNLKLNRFSHAWSVLDKRCSHNLMDLLKCGNAESSEMNKRKCGGKKKKYYSTVSTFTQFHIFQQICFSAQHKTCHI